jgi:DNA (cytosine-5)-methyltransferase 1
VTSSGCDGIDLFAGAGGLSYGLSCAGFNMKVGIEIDPHCATTLSRNHKDMKVIVSGIQSVEPKKVMEYADVKRGDLTIVAGGPPCRGFSQSNRRTRNLNNPLNALYKDFFAFVKAIRPHVFLLENVKGLKTLQDGIVLSQILRLGRKLGYHVQWNIVNTEDFSVPQRRKRIIFIGTPEKIETLFESEKRKIVTVREAIEDLPILQNGNRTDPLKYSRMQDLSDYQRLMRQNNGKEVLNNLVTRNNELVTARYKHIRSGGNWADIPSQLMSNYKNLDNCHRWIYYRLKWDEPSIVISNFRKNMLIHPGQDRGLSVREAARLQSFPDDYIFYGPLSAQQQQIANAVPPFLGEALGENIKRIVDD